MHSPPQLFQNSSKAKMTKIHWRLTPPTINCKLKQPTNWVQKTQKNSPQHQQILSNKYCVLPLFMWQWSADASRGVAYHIHLVQQVIVLILSMVLATCSGAFYLCIQAKMTWLSDASSSQPKSIGIISNGYLPNRKNNFTLCLFPMYLLSFVALISREIVCQSLWRRLTTEYAGVDKLPDCGVIQLTWIRGKKKPFPWQRSNMLDVSIPLHWEEPCNKQK